MRGRCLTSLSFKGEYKYRSMTPRFTRSSRFVAGLLGLAMGLVSSATCFAAIVKMDETQHHACCAGMNKDCDASMAPQGECCAVQNADVARIAGARPFTPSLVLINVLVVQAPLISLSRASFDPGVSRPPGLPTYLLVSTFRV